MTCRTAPNFKLQHHL